MNDEGVVREILSSPDAVHGAVKIQIGRATACEHCAASSVCAVKDVEVVARYSLSRFGDLRPGDTVKVDMPVKGGLKAAFIMYVLPLFGLGLGMTAGYALRLPEWGGLLLGLLMMALIYAAVAVNNRRFEADLDYMGEVVSVLEQGGGLSCTADGENGMHLTSLDTHYGEHGEEV